MSNDSSLTTIEAFVIREYDSALEAAGSSDVLHEALLDLMTNDDRFNPDHDGSGAYFRQKLRWRRLDEKRQRRNYQITVSYDRASPEPPPDEVASFKELEFRVRVALAALPDLERKVIEDKIAAKPADQSASELGISKSEVYRITYAARVRLWDLLQMGCEMGPW